MQDYLNLKTEDLEKVYATFSNLNSPMDQFEIKPFLGEFLGLNFTPIGLITNILVYIQLVVIFTSLFFVYATFKETIRING